MAERKHLLHVRSNQLNAEQNGPKLPTSEQIEYGEIAINYADGHEKLSIKNSTNEVVTIGTDEQNNAKFAAKVHTHTKSQITDFPLSLPASDVYSWAKEPTKPTYTAAEVGLGNVDNKSSETIRSEITKENVVNALGYTPPTSDTTYGVATTNSLGLVKSGTDITVDSSGNVSVNNNSHTHTKSNITDFPTSMPASDVYDWAKEPTKPTYTANEVGAIAASLKGVSNGVAELDSNGKVPSSQLPSFVDDVLEFTNLSSFPVSGEGGKIYIDQTTNKTYRWSGSSYVEISQSLALGTTSSTAYRGDYGNTAYQHSLKTSGNPHNVTKNDVGLGNVGNFKAVSTVANQGLSETEKSNARSNIGAGTSSFSGSYNDLTNKPTIPTVGNGTITITQNGTSKGSFTLNQTGNATIALTDNNTTYSVVTTSSNGLMSSTDKSKLDGIASGANNYTHPTSSGNKHIPSGGSAGQILRWSSDGTAVWGNDNNTTYNVATTSSNGLMSSTDKSKLDGIASGADSVSFTRNLSSGTKIGTITINGTNTDLFCQTNTDTKYSQATSSALGLVKIGYTENGKNYPVELDSNGKMFVNVPWTDTNTTYTLSSFGITATAAELNYCDGVTSNIQTQLNGKAASSHSHSWSSITSKPSTFTPSTHSHSISEITNLQTTLNAKLDSDYYTGHSTTTSYTIPVTKRLCIATLTTNGSLSVGTIPDGRELHIIIKNNASYNIIITFPSTGYVKLSGDTLEIPAGAYAEVNIISDGTTKYIRAT